MRTTGRTASSKHKRHKVKPVSRKQVRKSAMKSQLKYGRGGTLVVKKVVSQRGRTHWMEEETPDITKHQIPQNILMESTAIKKLRYKPYKQKEGYGTLRIWFVEGGVYDYANVPESVVLLLAQAQSKGNFFYYNIRTTYQFIRVR